MTIREIFSFGKYKGLSIQEVYQGTKEINKDLIKHFLIHQISFPIYLAKLDLNELIFIDTQNLEVKDGYIQTMPLEESYRGDWSRALQLLFRNRNMGSDRRKGLTSFDFYNLKIYSKGKSKPLIGSGNPYYIKWCIETIPDFYIEPKEIETLEKMSSYSYLGITVKFQTSDYFAYFPIVEETKFSFFTKTLKVNQDKFNSRQIQTTNRHRINHDGEEMEQTFERYSGSYAQDVEGYSDQDIDDIFGGEPDASWNIDW